MQQNMNNKRMRRRAQAPQGIAGLPGAPMGGARFGMTAGVSPQQLRMSAVPVQFGRMATGASAPMQPMPAFERASAGYGTGGADMYPVDMSRQAVPNARMFARNPGRYVEQDPYSMPYEATSGMSGSPFSQGIGGIQGRFTPRSLGGGTNFNRELRQNRKGIYKGTGRAAAPASPGGYREQLYGFEPPQQARRRTQTKQQNPNANQPQFDPYGFSRDTAITGRQVKGMGDALYYPEYNAYMPANPTVKDQELMTRLLETLGTRGRYQDGWGRGY